MPHDQEHVWVREAQAGDRQAFAALVERYWGRIHRWLSRLIDGRPDAEDLAQEVFLKAWTSLRSFQAGTHFRAWLFRIAHNLLVDHQRRGGRAPKAAHSPLGRGLETAPQRGALETVPQRGPGPVTTLIGRETQEVVREAVARLPAAFRAPFLLRTVEEMSYAEIAAATGLTEQTARWRVCEARRRLLHEIGPYLDRPTP